MQTSAISRRITSYSKVVKFNVMVLVLLVVAASMAVSSASTGPSAPADTCGAHVALVLDRSSSIGVDNFSGGREQSLANIAAIKEGASVFIQALQGPDSYMDVFAFASAAQRLNGAPGWFKLDSQENINIQKYAVAVSPYKQGVTGWEQDFYNDGLATSSEGLTNWEGALTTTVATRQDPLPSHIVMFTDGNPTTNQGEVDAALANGGNYADPNAGSIDPDDLPPAIAAANTIRSWGVKIIPIAVGSENIVNMANLQAIAGAGNPVYRSDNYAALTGMFQEAAANICNEPPQPVDGIELNKTVSQATAFTGQTVTYSFTVKNTGNTRLTNIRVTDPMLNGQVGTITSLNPGETSGVIGKDYIVPAGPEPRVIHNIATATGTPVNADNSPRPDISDDDPADVEVLPCACPEDGITIEKTVNPTSARRGDTVTYSFVVKNTGNTKLTNVKVTDVMLGGQMGAIIPELYPGVTAPVITKTYVIPPNATGIIHNVAIVVGTPVNPDGTPRPNITDDDPADVTVLIDSWTATKTANKSIVTPGETVTYTIRVTNTGNTTLTNLEVSDPTIGFPVGGGHVTIPTLAPGEHKDIVATYVIPANFTGTVFKNVAVVCLPKAGETKECKKPTVEVKIPRIQIVKTANKTVSFPGDTVIYTFVVKNTGAVDIDPTPVVDNILGVIGDPGILKPGESVILTKDYLIPATTPVGSHIINVATVCAPVPGTPNQPELRDTDCETTCPVDLTKTLCDQDDHDLEIDVPSITIVKTGDQTSATVGQTVNYTFVVTNTSKSITLKNITVVDNVLGTIGTIETLAPGESVTKTKTFTVPESAATAGSVRNIGTACFETPAFPANCDSDDHNLTVTRVLGATVTQLPKTGAQSLWLASVATLLVGLGAVLFTMTRRRRDHHTFY